MSNITPGWKFVALVAEGAPVSLQGHDPWRFPWLRSDEPFITVAHPTYPAQRHTMPIYELESPRAIRFAAGEFSNGVWGFFVPGSIADG